MISHAQTSAAAEYDSAIEAKASFDDVYCSPTPHNYFREMHRHEYRLPEVARPYMEAAIAFVRQVNPAPAKTRILDLGCSYGVGAALVKHRCSMTEVTRFFERDAPKPVGACVERTREWLDRYDAASAVECVGADSSEAAIKFAEDAQLIDAGIAKDFEAGDRPSREDVRAIERCNLLVSTGAIGYVGDKTLSVILKHLGRVHPDLHGPFAVVTILRMFDQDPISETFREYGLGFERVPDVHLQQRRFADPDERDETLDLVRERELSTTALEDRGFLYADLFVAGPTGSVGSLRAAMEAVHAEEIARLRASSCVAAEDLEEVVPHGSNGF